MLLRVRLQGLAEPRLLEWKTLVIQEMARHGVLSQSVLFPTPSHDDGIIDQTLAAFDAALVQVVEAWPTGSARPWLEGPANSVRFRNVLRAAADEAEEPCCVSTSMN